MATIAPSIRHATNDTPANGAGDLSNQALYRYRTDVRSVMALYAEDFKIPGPPAQLNQWELRRRG